MSPSVSIRVLQSLSDARLVSLAAAGNDRAFEAIVRRYRRQLLAYSRRLVPSEARGEDAVQQALLQAWLAVQNGVEIRDVRSWLYRIVHNTALNMQRSAGGREFAQLSQEARSSEPDPEDRIAISSVLSELAELPALQRQALLRTSLEGQSHDEVAVALGLTTGAVRGLIYRARATLRAGAGAVIPTPLLTWMLGNGSPGVGAPDRIAELVSAGGMSAAAGSGAAVVTVTALLAGAAVLPGAGHHAAHVARAVPRHAAASVPHVVAASSSPSSGSETPEAGLPATTVHRTEALRTGASRPSSALRISRAIPQPISEPGGSGSGSGSDGGRSGSGSTDGGGSGRSPSGGNPAGGHGGGQDSASGSRDSGGSGSSGDSGSVDVNDGASGQGSGSTGNGSSNGGPGPSAEAGVANTDGGGGSSSGSDQSNSSGGQSQSTAATNTSG